MILNYKHLSGFGSGRIRAQDHWAGRVRSGRAGNAERSRKGRNV